MRDMENIDFENKSKEELISLLTNQNNQIATQNNQITEQNDKIIEQNTKISELTTQVNVLNEYIALAKQRQFGAKSEKLTVNQLSFFDEAALPKNPEAILRAEEEIQVASFTRKK